MERFGDELRMEREHRQVTLDTICAMTKVSVRHLEALESGRLMELPGGVFRKGILRSYVTAVGLDETSWMEKFERTLREMGGSSSPTDKDWVEFAENVRKSRGNARSGSGARWLGVAVMLMTLVMLGWSVWKYVLHGHLSL
ncbi:MAG: helix-turn-helix domain-containing protein [Edaphobacter sp.]|uniref:helix-turn-helix domain-containing protein n=1 Tax=Edaphobacter sp. TaxID=1934404 RepID=UPI0023863E3F|nr:helix-turn-helix domain-containing protein [Edaphobacter sp.]MDE1175969.1 helix-turn-helix domain-containing protein [Edaphobacter sp.]